MDIRRWLTSSKGSTTKLEKEKNSKAKLHDDDAFDIKQKKDEQGKKAKKRARVILDSDSDEDPSPSKKRSVTPKKNEKSSESSSKKVKSESPEKKSSKKETAKSPKLKTTTSKDFFGSAPVVRNNKRTVEGVKKSREDSSVIHDDDDFNKTLKQLDKTEKKPRGHSSALHDDDDFSKTLEQLDNSEKKNKRAKKEEKPSKAVSEMEVVKHSTKEKTPEKEVPKKKVTSNSNDTEVKVKTEQELSKEAQAQKRREGYMLYKSFLDREGPRALGSKDIPEGEEGCLTGMSFIVTGILESIERDDAKTLIEKYGGKVMASVTKNTKYVVVGRDPGPGKMRKAETFGTKQLDEDGLFDLIRTSPGNSKGAKKKGKVTPKKVPSSDSGYGSLELKPAAPVAHELIKSFRREPKESSAEAVATSSQMNDSSAESVSPKSKKSPPKKNSTEDISESKPSVSKRITSSDASPKPVFEMWVDKYKPSSLKQVIGQQGDKSNAKKLLHWLLNWGNKSGKAKKPFPGKWNSQDDGSSFKAALLSGSPGVGKTTTAQLVCKEAGFDYFELNASDTRSKKTLKEVVAELFGNQTLAGCFKEGNTGTVTKRHAIIMDEVDGMAGNEDRGGMQELIGLIKSSHIPVICICNDRSHPKIRSLSNYCFDLRFQKPRVEQIKAAMMSVAYKEGLSITPNVLQDVIASSNQDIRQILHNLSMWTAKDKSLSDTQAKSDIGRGTKHIKMSPFDVLREVFAIGNNSKATINDKAELFFHDYSIAPLFVQENYLHVQPRAASGNKLKHLQLLSEAANSICDGDIVNRQIRSGSNWSLLPTQAIFSSVIPGELLTGYLGQLINFPAWLGKNSNRNYMDRILQELQMHMRMKITGNKTEVALDYLPLLQKTLTKPLLEKEADGIPETLSIMDHYYLLREDFDNIVELSLWPNQTDPRTKISPKVKSAFTRTYNKESGRNPYAVQNVTKKKKGQGTSSDLLGEEELENPVSEEEEDDSLENDAMVKVKKPSKKSSANEDAPSTSKKGEKTSKRGKPKKT